MEAYLFGYDFKIANSEHQNYCSEVSCCLLWNPNFTTMNFVYIYQFHWMIISH